jgi:hypothetical protein
VQLFREAVSLTTSLSLEFAQGGIVGWAGKSKSPFADVHFPFWAASACDGQGGRMKLTLMCSTMAAQVEFTGLHAAAMSLINSSAPSCSHFDLSRWGLLEVARAQAFAQANSAEPTEATSSPDRARDRSRSPPPLTSFSSTEEAPKGAKSGGKGLAKNHGRSGLEPIVIELLRAYYAKNWVKVGGLCDKIWHMRPNIQKHIPMWK